MAVTKVLIPSTARTLTGDTIYREVCLGRRPPTKGFRGLPLRAYLTKPRTVPLPASVDYWSKAIASLIRMYLNDQLGDCVIAGKGHAIGVWSGNESGTAIQATDQEIAATYRDWCGPGDNGCVITDVLDKMKASGFTAGGTAYKIDDYVSIDWTNQAEVQTALDLFGALTIGINLPQAWADGAIAGGTWDVTSSGIVGGHDVTVVGYTSTGVQISTWGLVPPITITWQAFQSKQWVEECYALLAPLWYTNANISPSGVDVTTLRADLAALGQGQIPPLPGPAPSPPSPPSPPVPPTPPAPVSGGYTGTLTYTAGVLTAVGSAPAPSVSLLDALSAAFADPQVITAGNAKRTASGALPSGLFIKLMAAIVPVVISDLAAGKTFGQMIPDLVSAILSVLA